MRDLYRIWEHPTVIVTIGAPLTAAQDPAPSRERSETVARDVMTTIVDLATVSPHAASEYPAGWCTSSPKTYVRP